MGLPPPLGASSRRVRCRLWVRSRAIHSAAGYLFRRRRSITPQAIHLAAGYLLRRRRYFAAGYSSRRRLSISPQALYYAAGYSFRRRRSRLKLHHRRHLSRDRDECAAAGKHPTVFNQVAVLGEFGREFKQGVSIIGQCRKIVL